MAHIKDVQIGEDTYLLEPRVYAETTGTASAITASITNFELATGVIVTLKIKTTNAENATLNVTGTGEKNIKYNDSNITAGALAANRFYSFVYDSKAWQLIGELDTNTQTITGVKGNAESAFRTGQVNLTPANIGAVNRAGDTMTGILNLTPPEGEGGQIQLNASTKNTAQAGIVLDQYNSALRIFGIASADGKTKTGVGQILTIDPYAKTITGGYTITGTLSGTATGFTDNKTITLTGDTTGSAAGGKGSNGWNITTTTKTLTATDNLENIYSISRAGTSVYTFANAKITTPHPSLNTATLLNVSNGTIYHVWQIWNSRGPTTTTSLNVSDLFWRNTNTTNQQNTANDWADTTEWNSPRRIIDDQNFAAFVSVDKDDGGLNLSETQASNFRGKLGLKAGAITDITDNTSKSDVTSSDTNLITARTLYYQLENKGYTTNKGTVTEIIPGDGLVNGKTASTSQTKITASGTISIKTGGVTNDMLAGSITNGKLVNSYVTIAGTKISLGESIDASTLVSNLGLSSAMKYKGSVSSLPSATAATTYSTYNAGDVITISTDNKEYVYNKGTSASNSKWVELGDESSYKIKQAEVSDPTASGTATAFIATIAQTANGNITATKSNLPTATTSAKGIMQVGTGLAVKEGTVSVSYGTTSTTAAAGNHTHGNITNAGTITSTNDTTITTGNKLVITDSDNKIARSNIEFDSTITNQWLNKSGAWSVPTIALTGAIAGNSTIDNSGNISVTTNRRMAFVGQISNTADSINTNNWYKVASTTITYQSTDHEIVFHVYETLDSTRSGILNVRMRSGNTVDAIDSGMFGRLQWEYNNNYNLDDFVLAFSGTGTKIQAELWTRCTYPYCGRCFTVIREGNRTSPGQNNSLWALYTTWSNGSQKEIPTGYTQVKSTLLSLQNSITGSAASLTTSRTINGTAFNGTSNITTNSWGASRKIYISDGTNTGTGVDVNGSADVTLQLPKTGAKGDIIYWSAANTPTHLTNTNSTTKQALTITSQTPSWVNISPTITVGAGTSTAAPTINTTVLGVSGTAQSITMATTGVYGVTKLQDGIASTSIVLAATANAAYTASRNSLHTLATTTKFYLTGCVSASTNTAGDDFDTGIYSTTTAGELSAVRHSFNISGAEKAYITFNSTDQSLDFIFN